MLYKVRIDKNYFDEKEINSKEFKNHMIDCILNEVKNNIINIINSNSDCIHIDNNDWYIQYSVDIDLKVNL